MDTLYKHNDVPHEMFRAIRITHPVKELSGNFSCEVIDEDEHGEELFQELASHSLYIYGEWLLRGEHGRGIRDLQVA